MGTAPVGRRILGYAANRVLEYAGYAVRPLPASPALRRGLAAGGTSAPPRSLTTNRRSVVDKLLDQLRAIQAHHRGMNVKPLRRLQRIRWIVDLTFEAAWPVSRFGGWPLRGFAACCPAEFMPP